RGHLYIAQPPLYKVSRGKSAQYIKDERSFEEFLIQSGLDDASLQLDNGEVRAGADLRAVIDDALAVRTLINGLHTRYSRAVVEQAVVAGALNADILTNGARAADAATYVAQRLDMIAEETERGWEGRVNPSNEGIGGLVLERTVRGVKESVTLDAALLGSADARALDRYSARLQEVYSHQPVLRRRETKEPVSGPMALLDAVFSVGRKGLTLQRYKGLGEMNA